MNKLSRLGTSDNNIMNTKTNTAVNYSLRSSQSSVYPASLQTNPSQSQEAFPANQQQLQQINLQTLQQETHPQSHYGSQYTRMMSTSDEEIEEFTSKENPWQIVKGIKRKKTTSHKNPANEIIVNNRFDCLSNDNVETSENNTRSVEKIPKPPPIFVYGVVNYTSMVQAVRDILTDEQYVTKTMANNNIKINTNTADSYRKLVTYMKENNIVHHTYQLKEERAFRVVIKHLHHSVDTADIKYELERNGHKVRNILNAKDRRTKEPLNMFFVDLEPAPTNKDVYKIIALQNKIVEIEPPRRYNNAVQCTRCQLYGHTKAYCNRPFLCVKCGGSHNSTICKKSKETPAICALCGGPHPANYRGCEYYHKLFKTNNTASNTNQSKNIQQTHNATETRQSFVTQNRSYAHVVNNAENTKNEESIGDLLSKFLDEFKSMFNQMMQQNSMILNMLTMILNKTN